MTTISAAIDKLVSYDWNDLVVTKKEQAQVLALLRGDGDLPSTINDLQASGGLDRVLGRFTGPADTRALITILARRGGAGRPVVRRSLERWQYSNSFMQPGSLSGFSATLFFDICASLADTASLNAFMVQSGTAISPVSVAADRGQDPFTGVGATGENPTSQSVGIVDSGLLYVGRDETVAAYSNPIPGSLVHYLRGLSAADRVQQARVVVNQQISTVFPGVYSSLPRRAQVMAAAGRIHQLQPELIAAFILAEQRDQSRNEDAKDYVAATNAITQANTSIGLGQVVITTAQRNDLFHDLLPASVTGSLSHNQVASLLASDEFNIFATARYIRLVANQAVGLNIANLPATQSSFPGIDMGAFGGHSRNWPAANVRALASEYTSKAWDDRTSMGWGWFVDQGFQTIINNGVQVR